MESFPASPPVEDVPELLSGGHLWILEDVEGDPLRFRLRADGRVEFGDGSGTFGGDPPPEYGLAVGHVRESLDRSALQAALDTPEAVTFLGVATVYRGIDYDWDRLPPFLGTEVHDGERFLEPGAVEGVYERLGLAAANALQKEVRASDFDPDRYRVPASEWYDGPALGVVLRDKTGNRGRIPNPELDPDDPEPVEGSPEELADRFVTAARVDGARADVSPGEFDPVFESVLDRIYREEAPRILDGRVDLDRRTFRSAVASRVREYLDGQ